MTTSEAVRAFREPASPERVDLVTAYSKRSDLAESLVRAVQQIERAQERGTDQRTSVRSEHRSDRQWRVADRLNDADVRSLVTAFEHGTPKWKLAEQYGISESSVKRLIRSHRAE
jgi:hypothetical protein